MNENTQILIIGVINLLFWAKIGYLNKELKDARLTIIVHEKHDIRSEMREEHQKWQIYELEEKLDKHIKDLES